MKRCIFEYANYLINKLKNADYLSHDQKNIVLKNIDKYTTLYKQGLYATNETMYLLVNRIFDKDNIV